MHPRSSPLPLLFLALACSSSSSSTAPPIPVAPTTSSIKHVIVVIQENHSFDAYFGAYCKAATGSNPSCTTGPSCCEAAPDKDPGGGARSIPLDDAANAGFDPNHTQVCELSEIDTGKMDGYVKAPMVGGAVCGSPENFAVAGQAVAGPYWQLAASYALADRYFQPVAGQSSSNDIYFARAKFAFLDNDDAPATIGSACQLTLKPTVFTDTTIGDLLVGAKVPWGFYAEGYQAMLDAQAKKDCPTAPTDCPLGMKTYPCDYAPDDNPFQYYKAFQNDPAHAFDFTKLAADLSSGNLPGVSFVKAIGYKSEHPGYGTTISAGSSFVTALVGGVQGSPYANDTLVLVTYDESGGYFDHVAPPPASAIDSQPYGPRVPLLAIGPFARKNFVSHVTMEHSSIVKFIEWNWLGGQTGQLGTRDGTVNNIGSMLDPAATGVAVPEK